MGTSIQCTAMSSYSYFNKYLEIITGKKASEWQMYIAQTIQKLNTWMRCSVKHDGTESRSLEWFSRKTSSECGGEGGDRRVEHVGGREREGREGRVEYVEEGRGRGGREGLSMLEEERGRDVVGGGGERVWES